MPSLKLSYTQCDALSMQVKGIIHLAHFTFYNCGDAMTPRETPE